MYGGWGLRIRALWSPALAPVDVFCGLSSRTVGRKAFSLFCVGFFGSVMGCSCVLWWDWTCLKAVVKCYLQLLSSSLWFNPLLCSSCVKCSMSSDCGGAADVLKYIIIVITGISFTGKDESESLFHVLPLAHFCEAARTQVNYFNKCLSAKLKNPTITRVVWLCQGNTNLTSPLLGYRLLAGTGKKFPVSLQLLPKEWISRAGTWVTVQERFRLAAAIWTGSFFSLGLREQKQSFRGYSHSSFEISFSFF